MIPAVRQQSILNFLNEGKKIAYLDELQQQLNISVSTLRRDLRVLSDTGRVVLLHGGGVQLTSRSNPESTIAAKLQLNTEAKRKIAHAAAQTVSDDDVIFLDPSSTTLEMIPFLVGKKVTVITNGILHISQLVANNIRSIMIGGEIKQATNSCIGPTAETTLQNYFFSKCFLGSNGFSRTAGITNHDMNECVLKQLAMKNSAQSYFLLDSSKYNVITMIKVVDLEIPIIYTDASVPELKEYQNIKMIE